MTENKKLTHKEMEEIIKNDDNVFIIDVRPQNEFESNHFFNAINIPIENIMSITNKVFYKNSYIFIYCASGLLSGDAKNKIEKLGYKNVHNMGGIYNWTDYLYIK